MCYELKCGVKINELTSVKSNMKCAIILLPLSKKVRTKIDAIKKILLIVS